MRDIIDGKPYDVKRDGSKHVISFYPQTANAKNLDTAPFRLILTKEEIKKLVKIAS